MRGDVKVGDKVRHQGEPTSRPGEVIGTSVIFGRVMMRVRWHTGVIETIHPDELQKVE